MHAILGLNELFNVYLEYNVQNNRYIDVAVFKRENSGIKYQAYCNLCGRKIGIIRRNKKLKPSSQIQKKVI